MACNKAEVPGGGNQLSAVATIDTQTKTVYTDNGVNAGMKVEWADADSFTAYYEGTKTLTINNALKVGDKVTLLRQSGGQIYFILDRI